MNVRERNEAEWRDPRNWWGGWLGFYRSRTDSRVVVPRRVRLMGWTINMGHPVGRTIGYGLVVLLGVTIIRRLLS